MATPADIKVRFPEFTDVLDARIQLFIDDAELLMASPVRWLTYYEVALAYHTAHLLYVALNSEQGDGGIIAPIKKQEVDDVIIEQAVSPMKADALDFNSTTYGKRYYSYVRICFMGIRST